MLFTFRLTIVFVAAVGWGASPPPLLLDPSAERWSRKDLGGDAAAQVLRLNGDLMAVTHGSLFRLNTAARRWIALDHSHRSYDYATPYGHELLTSSRKLGLTRLDAEGRVLERLLNPFASIHDYRKIVIDGAGRIWAANKQALVRIEGPPGSFRIAIQTLPGSLPCDPCRPQSANTPEARLTDQPMGLEVDRQGRLWVGYRAGIIFTEDGRLWQRARTDPPMVDVRSLTLGARDIWVAGRKSDAFYRLEQAGPLIWKATTFDPAHGYSPPGTFFVKVDSRGWIWRGSADGVHIADGRHLAPEDWLHLQGDNGLACGEADNFGFFEDLDGTVWIAGDQGITHLHPQVTWFDAPKAEPAVTTSTDAGGVLKVNVQIPPLARYHEYPARCRLAGSQWKISQDGTFEFHDLANPADSIEVAYSGNGPSIRRVLISGREPSRWPVWLGAMAILALTFRSRRLIIPVERLELIEYRLQKFWFFLRRRIFSPPPGTGSDGTAELVDLTGRCLLGRYTVERVVVHGVWSTIYAAVDQSTGKAVAIKQLAAPPEKFRGRFVREVATIRSVCHPNIVPVIDSWVDPIGQACLAMPMLEGPTLRERLHNGPLTASEIAAILRGTGSALAALHARGIVHRDVKPDNIILTPCPKGKWAPVLIDFGIATLCTQPGRINVTTTVAGSAGYMAPECLTGHYATSTDVYSLGVTTVEMLTSKAPREFETGFHDPSFARDLESSLRERFGQAAARSLTAMLVLACDPRPLNRPSARAWSHDVAALLDSAGHG